jgi:hypothetical protein
MGIPTITEITPNTGKCFGEYLIYIIGTNFRLPDLIEGDEIQESIRIYFGEVQIPKEKISVYSSTKIGVRVNPIWLDIATDTLPYLVDVTLQNIDDHGDPIIDEDVVESDGFSYVKSDLEIENYTIKIWKTLVSYLSSIISVPVSGKIHIDYDSDSTTSLPDSPSDPQLYVVGPRRERTNNSIELVRVNKINDDGEVKRLPRGYNYQFNIIGTSSSKKKLDNLSDIFEEAIRKMPSIKLNYGNTETEINVYLSTPPYVSDIINRSSNLLQFQAEIILEGIPALEDIIELQFDTVEEINLGISFLPTSGIMTPSLFGKYTSLYDGLWAYYPMDEKEGNTLYDASGNKKHLINSEDYVPDIAASDDYGDFIDLGGVYDKTEKFICEDFGAKELVDKDVGFTCSYLYYLEIGAAFKNNTEYLFVIGAKHEDVATRKGVGFPTYNYGDDLRAYFFGAGYDTIRTYDLNEQNNIDTGQWLNVVFVYHPMLQGFGSI